MKSAVYSWRISPEDKASLEHEARREGVSIAELLDRVIQAWFAKRRLQSTDEETEQARLRAAAARAIGTIRGGNPRRAENAKAQIRERLRERHDRERTD